MTISLSIYYIILSCFAVEVVLAVKIRLQHITSKRSNIDKALYLTSILFLWIYQEVFINVKLFVHTEKIMQIQCLKVCDQYI